MRKTLLAGLMLLAGACHRTTTEEPARTTPSSGASVAAGATPRAALGEFMNAVKTQDLQAMSSVWGDKNGPVRESKMPREDMEKREVYLMRCFRHDSYRVVNELPAANEERQLQVELTRGTTKRTTDFFVVKGQNRWYVRSAALEPVSQFCAAK